MADDVLLDALEELRDRADELPFPLQAPDAAQARKDRDTLVNQLVDYLIPRLREIDAPVLAVVGGSTGAGKSTLVNSLLRARVTRSGVLRPTTRSPVLVHHPEDEHWFTSDRVLPGLARLTGNDPEPDREHESRKITSVRLAQALTLPPGLALLDAPDIDSVVDANREVANQLLAAADLWLFVTTAARYADAVPWELLRTAASRGTSVAIVLDRVPPEAIHEIHGDLSAMLAANGLAQAPLFVVPEAQVGDDGFLPPSDVAQLRAWLVELAASAANREQVVRRTLAGALDSLRTRIPALTGAAQRQVDTAAALRADVDNAFADAAEQLEHGLTDGSLLRGEVLARWHEFVGTGEFFKNMEQTIGRWRDRLTSMVSGRPAPATELTGALQTGVAALIHASIDGALEQSARSWNNDPAGRALLAGAGDQITRVSPGFEDRVERLIRDWQAGVLELVRAEGSDRRTQARMLSFGVNGLAVVLMIVVFASTAFVPTGAEVGVGAGTAVVGQRLLEAVFGDQAVRSLAKKARTDLITRVHELAEAEKARFVALLDQAGVSQQRVAAFSDAANAVQSARAQQPTSAVRDA